MTFKVKVQGIIQAAQGILSFELLPYESTALPAFMAGAHIDVHLPNGLVRSYSLTNSQVEEHRYVIAVNRDSESRGGSRFMHEVLRSGDLVVISAPRNNFRLIEDAANTVFIAGGIGITPLWSMIQRLEHLGRNWQLYYSSRTRANAAFLAELSSLENRRSGRVHFNFDHEQNGKMIDLAMLEKKLPADAQLYCCGPAPMLAAFQAATKARAVSAVHLEYFSAVQPIGEVGGFTIVLARTGRTIVIPPGKTILETILGEKIDVPCSCMQGVCGTCEVKVLEGTPDHRDAVLNADERAANKTMMICCSGSKTERLVLDI